jgi:hypothetical protein
MTVPTASARPIAADLPDGWRHSQRPIPSRWAALERFPVGSPQFYPFGTGFSALASIVRGTGLDAAQNEGDAAGSLQRSDLAKFDLVQRHALRHGRGTLIDSKGFAELIKAFNVANALFT